MCVLFIDEQTGDYSAHTTIEGMFDMLRNDWLSTVAATEEYPGEYEEECRRWSNANEEEKRALIESYEYEIVDNMMSIGRWWNDSTVELMHINGEVYALSGWNGESWTKSWKCDGEGFADASGVYYNVKPLYEAGEVCGYEVY